MHLVAWNYFHGLHVFIHVSNTTCQMTKADATETGVENSGKTSQT